MHRVLSLIASETVSDVQTYGENCKEIYVA